MVRLDLLITRLQELLDFSSKFLADYHAAVVNFFRQASALLHLHRPHGVNELARGGDADGEEIVVVAGREGVTPNCSESQREVRFFSNKTILIRLISSIFYSFIAQR